MAQNYNDLQMACDLVEAWAQWGPFPFDFGGTVDGFNWALAYEFSRDGREWSLVEIYIFRIGRKRQTSKYASNERIKQPTHNIANSMPQTNKQHLTIFIARKTPRTGRYTFTAWFSEPAHALDSAAFWNLSLHSTFLRIFWRYIIYWDPGPARSGGA